MRRDGIPAFIDPNPAPKPPGTQNFLPDCPFLTEPTMPGKLFHTGEFFFNVSCRHRGRAKLLPLAVADGGLRTHSEKRAKRLSGFSQAVPGAASGRQLCR